VSAIPDSTLADPERLLQSWLAKSRAARGEALAQQTVSAEVLQVIKSLPGRFHAGLPDASPAIECLSPELAPPITATGAIEMTAGVRLVEAARKRVPITASGWQHF